MLKKDKTYYLINSLIMLFLLVLSPIYSNDIHLSTGDNLVSYPFDLIQSFEDGISKENLSNVWGISSNGKSKQKINGDWYGSLDLFEPNQEYWLSVNHSSDFHFNYPILVAYLRKIKNLLLKLAKSVIREEKFSNPISLIDQSDILELWL